MNEIMPTIIIAFIIIMGAVTLVLKFKKLRRRFRHGSTPEDIINDQILHQQTVEQQMRDQALRDHQQAIQSHQQHVDHFQQMQDQAMRDHEQTMQDHHQMFGPQ